MGFPGSSVGKESACNAGDPSSIPGLGSLYSIGLYFTSPVTSTTGHCFCFGSVSSFFLELFLHSSSVAYWAPTDLENSSFSVISFCLFILCGFSYYGVLKARILRWFAIPFSSGPYFVRTLHHDPSVLGGPTQHGS